MRLTVLLKEQCTSVEEDGPGYPKDIWGKALGCGEGSACPVKLKGDKTTDPGDPSHSQPLPDIYAKKPRFFSKWITIE